MIVLLIGAIISLYISEWRQLEKLEQEVKHINVLRQKVHDAYAKKLELAMHGETILTWVRYKFNQIANLSSRQSVATNAAGIDNAGSKWSREAQTKFVQRGLRKDSIINLICQVYIYYQRLSVFKG